MMGYGENNEKVSRREDESCRLAKAHRSRCKEQKKLVRRQAGMFFNISTCNTIVAFTARYSLYDPQLLHYSKELLSLYSASLEVRIQTMVSCQLSISRRVLKGMCLLLDGMYLRPTHR